MEVVALGHLGFVVAHVIHTVGPDVLCFLVPSFDCEESHNSCLSKCSATSSSGAKIYSLQELIYLNESRYR